MGARAALVTGAGRGIGAGIAARLLADGYRVVGADLSFPEAPDGLEWAATGDLTAASFRDSLVTGTLSRCGRIDVLVNNAGLGGETPVVDMTDEQWDRVLDITLNSTFRATRAALLL